MRSRSKRLLGIFNNIFANSLKLNSIQTVITLSFTLITIFTMVLVGVILYNKFSDNGEKNAYESSQQIVDQLSFNLEYYLKGMTEVSDLISTNIETSLLLEPRALDNLFDLTMKISKDIVTIGVFYDDGKSTILIPKEPVKNGLIIAQQDWYKIAVENPDKIHFLSPHVQNLFASNHKWVVSLSRIVNFYKNRRMNTGVLLVDMNFSGIEELCQRVSLGKRGFIYIVDKNGNIVYHPQQQIIYAGLKNENIDEVLSRKDGSYTEDYKGEKRLVTIKTMNYSEWKVVGIGYMNELVTSRSEINTFIIFIFVFGIVFAIAVSMFVSAKISQPIKRLESLMRKVEQGDFNIRAEEAGEDEVKHLSRTFNVMINRIKNLMEQNIIEQESKRKSELKALQSQINPHFLYNTLDSIVWMAENNKIEGVITMVGALAKLFRISISKGQDIITVENELEHARNYLIIQKIRYKDKLEYSIEAEPETLKCKSLKIILQPMIENALYHGIEHMVDKGNIRISSRIVDDKVLLQVADNGLGMPEEKLKKILSSESISEDGSGVGVKNVHERIQIYFGKEYGLEIKSELEEGTTVNIWLPNEVK